MFKKNGLAMGILLALTVTGCGGGGGSSPSSTPNDIEKAKALVQETRTWVTSLESLQSPADAFAGETKTLVDTLSGDAEAVLNAGVGATVGVLGAVMDLRQNEQPVPSSMIWDGATFNITWSESPTTKLTLSTDSYHGVKLNYTVSLDQPAASLNSNNLPGKTVTGKLAGTSSNTKVATTLDVQLQAGFKSGVVKPVVSSISLQGNVKLAKQSSGIATGEEVTGGALIEFVTLNNSNVNEELPLGLSRFKLGDLTVKDLAGSSAGLGVDLKIDNAASFDALSFLDGGCIDKQQTPNSCESASHFMDASLNITGNMALKGYPAATVSILIDRTALDAATASVILTYNGKMLDIEVAKSEATEGTGTIEVTNASGAKLLVNVKEGSGSGTVSVNGKPVGTISDGILRYSDGTFESLR